MSEFGDKGGNKPLKRKEESKANQQYEEGHKVQTEDISDSLNQYSHLSDTAVDTCMSTSGSCNVETSEENTVFAHINEDGESKFTNFLCGSCSSDNLQVEATHFCKTCDDPDPLCETCAKHHLRQKLSKDHKMCRDIEEFRKMEQKACDNGSERLLCEPCSTDNVKVKASHFCKTCDDPDPLCETCAKHHLKQKLSKDHEMCRDIAELRKMEPKKSDNGSKRLLCEPCSTDNVQVEATHFCKTCNDPDPLCETCAKHHLKQKVSKDHKICADMEEFRKMEQKACDNVSENLLCEPCSTDNVQVEATHFCKTCEDPDPLCETCAKHHLKQKLSKDHKMSADIEELRKMKQKACVNVSKEIFCEHCFTDDIQVEATHFCKTCDDPDPLCETCAKHHLKQKLTKDHEMCRDIEEFRKMKQKACDNVSKRLLCEPCSTDNVQVEATHFCKTCDDPDPLCETCAKHHLKQKLSKDHKISADIKDFRYIEQNSCENISTKLLCEPCSTDDLHVEATHFCKTCDDPDPLCKTCSKHHLKQKLTKNHEICAEIKELQKEQKKWYLHMFPYKVNALYSISCS
eukprot:XP_019924494.1 PREDICTED: major surface trophozoite antigen 11-like [Crassostrea gigas]